MQMHLLCKNASRQSERSIIRPPHSFLLVIEWHNAHDWTEDLFFDHRHLVVHIDKNGRCEIQSVGDLWVFRFDTGSSASDGSALKSRNAYRSKLGSCCLEQWYNVSLSLSLSL